jgi:hypothetical protein
MSRNMKQLIGIVGCLLGWSLLAVGRYLVTPHTPLSVLVIGASLVSFIVSFISLTDTILNNR